MSTRRGSVHSSFAASAAQSCPIPPLTPAAAELLKPIISELRQGQSHWQRVADLTLELTQRKGKTEDEALAVLFTLDLGIWDGAEAMRCDIAQRGKTQIKTIKRAARCHTAEKSGIVEKSLLDPNLKMHQEILRAGNICEIE